ncbi:myb/SANT-like DNA-binding domain-containing protein [Phthorimaea operculella]|nr:myb/SANT-like DNA-binding domain-containing protein [Phthorimaea operculella]
MERRKASPEQLNMLLHFLEDDRELAIGKFVGLEGRIRQTNTWIKITEKLNASSGFGSGAIKTPDKWQQTWRDWKSNVRKKAFKIRKNRFTPGCTVNTQLTEAEQKILRLICTNTAVFGLPEVSETDGLSANSMLPTQSNRAEDMCIDPSTSTLKWQTEQQFAQELEMNLNDGVVTDPDAGLSSNVVSSAPITKPLWKRGRPARLVQDRLLGLEEERIKIEKQKLLEKKRCNNIRLKIEKERLDIERQRNVLLEKLLVAVEAVAHRQ